MADCHDLFQTYLGRITPGEAKQDYLRTSREAIRDKIRKYFKDELELTVPKFWGQGSYAIKTLIVPLSGEYDIDDGVYLTCLDKEKEKWETCQTVHKWIWNAVKGHTDEDPIDKETCVRVVFARQYHVDLPIYSEYKGEYYLAITDERGWHASNPRAVVEWFRDQVKTKGDQLRRIVKYFKGWADFKSDATKMPSSFLLTVLISNNYEGNDRDDVCFAETIENVYAGIKDKFEVKNPVDEKEILSDRMTKQEKEDFKALLLDVIEKGGQAVESESKKESSELWQKVFGSRFPIENDEGGKKVYTSGPALLRNDARSAR